VGKLLSLPGEKESGRFGVFVIENSDSFKAPLTFRQSVVGATAPRQGNGNFKGAYA
jgi:hypothetical protein